MSKRFYGINEFLDHHGSRGKRTLVVGSKVYPGKEDRRSLYKNAVGLDMLEGEGVDIVHDLMFPLPEEVGKFDHIDIVSVLEHVEKPWLLCENLLAVMNPNATILVSTPFVWRVHAYPSDFWRLTVEAYDILFPSIEWVEKGYLMDEVFQNKTLHATMDGKVFFRRSEAIGYGILIP